MNAEWVSGKIIFNEEELFLRDIFSVVHIARHKPYSCANNKDPVEMVVHAFQQSIGTLAIVH